jgi:hypothetical protein
MTHDKLDLTGTVKTSNSTAKQLESVRQDFEVFTAEDNIYQERAAVFPNPDYSEWQCKVFGGDGIVWTPLKGKHPNWFWRKMQYLCFGNKWEKVK